MLQIELTKAELFKSLTEPQVENFTIDLHNEFDCNTLKFYSEKELFTIEFSKGESSSSKWDRVELMFYSVQIKTLVFNFNAQNLKPTIDMIYRGRFESDCGVIEIDAQGKYCFYISFVEDCNIEIWSKQVVATIS